MMFLASELNTAGAGVAALLGYSVVFLGLIALMLVGGMASAMERTSFRKLCFQSAGRYQE